MAKSKSSGLASFILFLAAILQLLNVYAAETDIDSSRSFAKPVMSSVTAEFIQFLRQHEQVFQAVEQIAAEDEDEMNAQERRHSTLAGRCQRSSIWTRISSSV